MARTLNGLEIRRRLGREDWGIPQEYGPEGWIFQHTRQRSSIIVSLGLFDGVMWTHASMSHQDVTPSYSDLVHLHAAVWQGVGWAYQVFAPSGDHVNIHEYALHLWGRLDGLRPESIPNFGWKGTI